MTCKLCDGPLVWIGSLGTIAVGELFYYRCRNCGVDWLQDQRPTREEILGEDRETPAPVVE